MLPVLHPRLRAVTPNRLETCKDVDFTVRWSSWQDGLHRGLSSSLKESTVLLDIVHCASEAFCNKALHKACLNWQVILNVLRGRGR